MPDRKKPTDNTADANKVLSRMLSTPPKPKEVKQKPKKKPAK